MEVIPVFFEIGRNIRKPLRVLPDSYLSVTIDISLILGGHWWGDSNELCRGVSVNTAMPLNLKNERLISFAKHLAPAMLRIGGTEADRIWYKPGRKAAAKLFPLAQAPQDEPVPASSKKRHFHEYVITKKLWKEIHQFLDQTGMDLLFTVSAGPADRDENGQWKEENARKLMAYSRNKGYNVAAWEFGNEVNGFPFIYGWKDRVKPSQYVRDFARFGHLVKSLYPESKILGPSSAVWPLIGEPYPLIPRLCKSPAAIFLDAVSWHYYPQQSARGPWATRRASPHALLASRALDGVLRWNRRIRDAVDKANAIRPAGFPAENWVTETGHALYGGEPGLSDSFASVLWWLDELGLLARDGVARVFRQALIGGSYGLLDEQTMAPRPDFYASFLWKQLMGPRVHDTDSENARNRHIRFYMHSRNDTEYTLLVISIDSKKPARFFLRSGHFGFDPIERYLLQGNGGFTAKTMLLNGVLVEEDLLFGWRKKKIMKKYKILEPNTAENNRSFVMPPLSALFLRFYFRNDRYSEDI